MSLKKHTVSGVIWTFADTFLLKGLLFLAMILLARWIGPKEFGLMGMMAVFVASGLSITDSGMTQSLIRTKNPNSEDYSTVFFLNLLMSFIFYTIIYFSAPFIADFFNQNALVEIIRIYCLIFFIIACSAVQTAILTREMKFSKITKINIPSILIGVTVGLFLGYQNYGVWSIVWMYLSIELVKTVLLWSFSNWKPKLIFSKEKFKIHYNFGYKLMLSGLLDTLFNNLYNILIGKYFSVQALGFYERSKQFSEYPSATLTGVIGRVTYPLLSQIQDNPEKLENVYKRLLRVSFFVIAPIMLGLAAVAKPLFLLALGDNWLPAVLFFQILCLALMLYPIHAFNLNILKVYGRSDLFLKLEIIKKCIITISVIIAFQFGIMGLIWSNVFTSFAALGVNMYYSSNLINYPVVQQIKDLVQTLILALLMAFIMYQIVCVFSNELLILQLITSSLCGIFTYLGISYLYRESPLHDGLKILKSRNE